MKKLKFLMLGIMAISLSACMSSFKSDVTTFHMLPAPKGEKVSIVPIDPKKHGSLEFQSYAALVGQELGKLGYVPAKDDKPDLIVGLDYQMNDGREKLRTFPSFRSNLYWNNWRGFGYWHTYDPFFMGGAGIDNEIRATTVYKTMLNLEIRKPKGEKLYEGRAESEGREKSMPVVIPQLVEAIFQRFPGPSGQTVRVVVEPKEK